jgi:hypothetical protein
MPTPFTHLEIAQRLLRDEEIPQIMRDILDAQRGAFLLGSIAADARVGSGLAREKTHFYAYGQPILEHPWRVMVQQNPALLLPDNAAHQAFVAGYVAHLSVDETWSKEMVGPHFVLREWGDRMLRFYMLHIILIYMDERDFARLESWQSASLQQAEPQHWLDFASDADLIVWRDLIYQQIKPDGISQTLDIFGGRIGKQPEEMRAFLDSPQEMQAGLWDNITPDLLTEVEASMYAHARTQMTRYFQESLQAMRNER